MWIQIFKSGEHRDSKGAKHSYSNEGLDEMAAIYNGQVEGSDSFEAPLVKGHPKSDAPAFGWVERLRRRGDVLFAKLKNVSPEIVEEVHKGKFKKVSVALYPNKMLRHVGLLGAAVPAVKGLQTVKFEEEKEFLEFNEACEPEDFLTENEKLDILTKENKALRNKINEMEQTRRCDEYNEFAEGLVKRTEGTIINPSNVDSLVNILEHAYSLESDVIEFSNEVSLVEKIKVLLSDIKPAGNLFEELDFGEYDYPDDFDFSGHINPERHDIHKRAIKLQKQNPEMNYEDALSVINKI